MGDLLNRGTKQAPLWYCRFTDLDGRRVQRPTGASSKVDARIVLEGYEDRVRQGLPGCPRGDRGATRARVKAAAVVKAERATLTVEQLARRFLGEVDGVPGYTSPKIKSIISYRRAVRSRFNARILPVLGKRLAAEVTTLDVERMRDADVEANRSAETIGHLLGALSKLYNWASRSKLIDCPNPVRGVERPRPSHSLDYLTADEVARLLARAEDGARIGVASWDALVLPPMVAVAVYAGLRKGELLGLRWNDVHIEIGRLDVLHSYKLAPKSGKARHLPLHPALVPILRAWKKLCPATPLGLVFPVVSPELFRARMGQAEDALGITTLLESAECHLPADGKPWHMLRHTFASNYMMAGNSLFSLQQLLGHSTPMMAQRYAHLAPSFLAVEMARLSFAPSKNATVHPIGGARADDIAS